VSKTKKKVLIVTLGSVGVFCVLAMSLPLPGFGGVAHAAVPEVPVGMIPPLLLGLAAIGRKTLAHLR
jgi:hypothetical protein